MFRHLDDPTPPQPTDLVVDRIVAEGARRVLRRRVMAGSTAAVLLALGVAGIAGALPGIQEDDNPVMHPGPDEVPRSSTTSSSSTTTTEPSTTTSTTGSGGTGPTTPGPDEGGDVFAAAIQKPNADVVQIVLANTTTNEVDRVLTEFPMIDRGGGCCVSFSDDRRYVYYVVEAGTFEEQTDMIWRVPTNGRDPEKLLAGTRPVVSPDGRTLLFLASGVTGADLVVHDLASGDERRLTPVADDVITSYGFTESGEIVFSRAAGGEISKLYQLNPGATVLTDARSIGPPAGSDNTTSWAISDVRARDNKLAVVQQTGGIGDQTEASLLYVDPTTGATVETLRLLGRDADVANGISGLQLSLIGPSDSPGPSTLYVVKGMEWIEVDIGTVLAVDW